MHVYATNADDRKSVPLWLAAFSVIAALILSSVTKILKWEIPWWIDAPSVMGFYGIFHKIFDQKLWAIKIWLFSFSSIPNLTGTWVGSIHSNYQGGMVFNDIILTINQTWTEISIQIRTETSHSFSTMALINAPNSSEATLKYEYINEPSSVSVHTMSMHRGTVNLRLSHDNNFLEGDYFTGRGRQTIGDMKFYRVSNKLLTKASALKLSIP
jgi:hypothetical protein